MKTKPVSFWRTILRSGLLLLSLLMVVPAVRAGLAVEIHLYTIGNFYFVYSYLNLDGSGSPIPAGDYLIAAPQYPNGGTSLQYQSDGTNLNYLGGGGGGFNDFPSLMQSITNGQWSIQVTNAVSTNIYTFSISAPNFASNPISLTTITFPADGATNVIAQPNFTWQGPTGWQDELIVSDTTNSPDGYGYQVAGATLAPDQTNWIPTDELPGGTNHFNINYISNITGLVVVSTPVDGSLNPISGWSSTATMETYASSEFVVGAGSTQPGGGTSGHTLVAHYSFDADVTGTDDSGNGNSFFNRRSIWGVPVHGISSDTIAGPGAIQYHGNSSLSAFYTDSGTLFSNLVSTLAGSFTVSLWLNSSVIVGSDNNPARNGGIVIYDYNADSMADGVIPVAITGSKVAFYTGDAAGVGSTLHSATSVVNSDDTYYHVVVTRDQISGLKQIYINGVLDASGAGSMDYLNGDTNFFSLGGVSGNGYNGLLDDVQIYSGVLSPQEVAYLFQNPGVTVSNVAGSSGGSLAAYYDFDEGVVTAADLSGNNRNLVHAGNFGGGGPVISPDGIAGAGSVQFDGGSYITAPSSLLPVMAGTFTISLWVNTVQYMGDPGNAQFLGGGAGIISADVSGLDNDLVPMCLTAGLIGFNTGGNSDDLLDSATEIDDNNWHHVVVTRDQATGTKQIYIDDSLDVAGSGTTNLLNAPQLLVLGGVADASAGDPNSPSVSGYSGFDGELDDIQVYNRVLRSDEVDFLYNNPGHAISNSLSQNFSPVSVDLSFSFYREEDPLYGEYFLLFPNIGAVTPALITTNSVESPTGQYSADQNGASSLDTGTFGEVLGEITNGLWHLFINKGDPSEQRFTFTLTNVSLDPAQLPALTVFTPTNGATSVSANPTFTWSGLANFSSVNVNVYQPGIGGGLSESLPGAATSWQAPAALNAGTNRFQLNFNTNDVAGWAFSTPINQGGTPMASFTTHLNLYSESGSIFQVGLAATAVQLVNIHFAGGATSFQFLSQNGVNNTIQSRTNLSLGQWEPRGAIPGDGNLKTVSIPATNGPAEFFRVVSQ